MQIFYINVAGRTERRALMESQFSALGLEARRIEATVPAELTEADQARWANPRRLRWLSNTELSCSLSHLAALREIASGEASMGAVFEDDVVLSPRLPEFLKDVQSTPPLSDLIRLESDNRAIRLAATPEQSIGNFVLSKVYGPTSGAAGYLVSRDGAARILKSGRFMQVPVDHALFNPYERLARSLRMRQLEPALCVQRDRVEGTEGPFTSDLEAERRGKADRARRQHLIPYVLQSLVAGVERELWAGPQLLFHQLAGHSSKRMVPLAGAPKT